MEKDVEKRFEKVEGRVDKVESFISQEGLSRKGKLIKCDCGYSWLTKSRLSLITCPSCGRKIRIK